jgi:glycosyltransferase involved in cell wall biosynthesis
MSRKLPVQPFDRTKVFVVIPAYNEGRVLASTVWSLLPYGYSVVVVDDGSTDGSAEALEPLAVHYLRHPVNLGQGAALETGMEYALAQGAAFIIHFDADGQHPAAAIEAFLEPLRAGECDVAVGSRFLKPEDRALVPAPRRILLRAAVILSALLTRVWLSDAHNGFRALTAEAARQVRLRENGFAHATEFVEQVRRAGLRWREIPVAIRYTAYSRGKGQKSSNSVNILIEILLRKFL